MVSDGGTDVQHRSGDAVLQGLCGQLVLSYLDTEDLRACIETSRSLRSMASACVKSLAPRMGLEALAHRCAHQPSESCSLTPAASSSPRISCRFPTVTRLSLDLAMHGEALDATGVSACLRSLAPFRLLQHLQLRGMALTDAALPELAAAGLPRLESIDIRGCSKVTGLLHCKP